MAHDYVLVDVFTDTPFGGNQLAVLPDARGLEPARMQQIAREFNFAETTFVLPAEHEGSTARLRIFSPNAEMPFAGHPTVGSAAVLARLGAVPVGGDGTAKVTFEEQVGLVHVDVEDHAGYPGLWARLRLDRGLEPTDGPPDRAAVAAALSLPADSVVDAWFGSVGLRFCFCQVRSADDVDRAVLDKAAWAAALAGAWAQHLFFFAGDLTDGGHVHARMFAPAIGVDEDPATGSACAALAGYAASRANLMEGTLTLNVRQGVKMGRPSTITAGSLVTAGEIRNVTVGGNVSVFASGTIDEAASR